MWDTSSRECEDYFEEHTEQVMGCAWVPDGNVFYSGGSNKKVYKWGVESGETIASYTLNDECMDLELSKDRKGLVC